ncbi:Uncharacterised protein [Bordetella pertussis]|nr:Uncharacterised protein [Bordetella pertussis]
MADGEYRLLDPRGGQRKPQRHLGQGQVAGVGLHPAGERRTHAAIGHVDLAPVVTGRTGGQQQRGAAGLPQDPHAFLEHETKQR